MRSSEETQSCTTCGQDMALFIQVWVNNWLKSLLARVGFEFDPNRDIITCNFSKLAEQLFTPRGEKVGLRFLSLKQEPVEQATCAY